MISIAILAIQTQIAIMVRRRHGRVSLLLLLLVLQAIIVNVVKLIIISSSTAIILDNRIMRRHVLTCIYTIGLISRCSNYYTRLI